jgi:single-strand DNA-binding protein
MALNQIVIHGRLTADPELKQTPSGVSVCTITVAVDRSFKNGEEKQTDFFTVVCWRGLADMVGKFFQKGKEILVSGNMQSRKWQDKEGNNRVSWEILAQNVDFCGSKGSGGNATTKQSTAGSSSEFVEISPDDDSLPF